MKITLKHIIKTALTLMGIIAIAFPVYAKQSKQIKLRIPFSQVMIALNGRVIVHTATITAVSSTTLTAETMDGATTTIWTITRPTPLRSPLIANTKKNVNASSTKSFIDIFSAFAGMKAGDMVDFIGTLEKSKRQMTLSEKVLKESAALSVTATTVTDRSHHAGPNISFKENNGVATTTASTIASSTPNVSTVTDNTSTITASTSDDSTIASSTSDDSTTATSTLEATDTSMTIATSTIQ